MTLKIETNRDYSVYEKDCHPQESDFNVKSESLRRDSPLSYTEQILFILSFNVPPYFQLKKFI